MTICLLTGLSSVGSAGAVERRAVQRDVEDYAIATCLDAQNQPYLKDQGDAMAATIIQRGHGALDTLTMVANTVKQELGKGGIPIIHNEETGDKALPVLYCVDMIDKPAVRKAIETAILKLAPAYHRQ